MKTSRTRLMTLLVTLGFLGACSSSHGLREKIAKQQSSDNSKMIVQLGTR